jgi:hypothetical protein
MTSEFEETKKRLSELAVVINEFKSEAVQLRVLEWVFEEWNGSSGIKDSPKPPAAKKAPAKRKKLPTSGTPDVQGDKVSRPRSSGGRPGPLKMINRLISEGFFKNHQTISKITEYCKEKYAYIYEIANFSPALGRAIRAGKLSREKNQDSQYEYFEP